MVREMYGALGFTLAATEESGAKRWALSLEGFQPVQVPIQVELLREAMA